MQCTSTKIPNKVQNIYIISSYLKYMYQICQYMWCPCTEIPNEEQYIYVYIFSYTKYMHVVSQYMQSPSTDIQQIFKYMYDVFCLYSCKTYEQNLSINAMSLHQKSKQKTKYLHIFLSTQYICIC